MTVYMKIGYGTASDLVLTDGVLCGLVGYAPKAGGVRTTYTEGGRVDIGRSTGYTLDATVEAIDILLIGNATTIRGTIKLINNMLVSARLWAQGLRTAGAPLQLFYDPDNSGAIYRSRIIDGSLQVEEDYHRGLVTGAALARLTITRQPYFTDSSVGNALTLANPWGSTSGGIRIDNTEDATRHNWADINPMSNVTGDMPSYAWVQLQNTDATYTMRHVYIGASRLQGVASYTHIYEGEGATNNGAGGAASVIGDGSCSNGNYLSKNISGTAKDFIYWPLTSGTMTYGVSSMIRVMVRFHGSLPAASDLRLSFRVNVVSQTGVCLYQSGQTLVNTTAGPYTSQLVDLGGFILKPVAYANDATYYFTLEFQRDSGAATSFAIDYVGLIPYDNWRYYFSPVNLGQNAALVDKPDAYEPVLHALGTLAGGLNSRPNYIAYGGPLMLYPPNSALSGTACRIFVFSDDGNGAAMPAQTKSLRIYRMPRWSLGE